MGAYTVVIYFLFRVFCCFIAYAEEICPADGIVVGVQQQVPLADGVVDDAVIAKAECVLRNGISCINTVAGQRRRI